MCICRSIQLYYSSCVVFLNSSSVFSVLSPRYVVHRTGLFFVCNLTVKSSMSQLY